MPLHVWESDEEPKESCMDKLFRFLLTAQAHKLAPIVSMMFNVDFPLKNIMENCRIVLGEQEQEFEGGVSGKHCDIGG